MTAVEICVPYGRAGTRAGGRAGRGGTARLPGVPGVAGQAWGVIVGIGVDLVDIARLDQALRRTPALAARLFTEGERGAPPASLAACFAAKEAAAKALGGPPAPPWAAAQGPPDRAGPPGPAGRGARARPAPRPARAPPP